MIGIRFDKTRRPLVLIIFDKISGYVEIFKVQEGDKDKSNKRISFHIDDEELLGKNKAIWANTKDLKNIDLNALPV